MPSRTNQDRIGELEREVARLVERVDNLRRELERTRDTRRERSGRLWALAIALISLLGGILGGLLPELIRMVRPMLRR